MKVLVTSLLSIVCTCLWWHGLVYGWNVSIGGAFITSLIVISILVMEVFTNWEE